MAIGSELTAGHEAFDAYAWADAYLALSAADASSPLGADDLERLATAAYLSGHDLESTDTWIRAYRARMEAGEQERAVGCAFWLGFGLFQRGDMAQGGGWMARARSLVEEHGLDCAEAGYLLVPAGLMALHAGDTSGARDLFRQARSEGGRFGDLDLATFGCLGEGQALLRAGQRAEAFDRLDEAMVSVAAGELSPVVAGIVYCAVIEECQAALDVRRAQEWTSALSRWCDVQPGLVPYRGQCLVHRSQVMQLHGRWGDALAEAERAQAHLGDPPHPGVGMAHYQLGELCRLRGDLGRAEEAYRLANDCGRPPQPGLALLRVAQGRAGQAALTIERALEEAADEIERAQLLPAAAEIMLAAGLHDAARSAVDDLAVAAARAGTPVLQAAASYSTGAVLLAEGRPADALAVLRGALRRWQSLEVPYEAARVRTAMATAYRDLGDDDSADLEVTAARRAFVELGAAPALARLQELFGPGGPSAGGPSAGGPSAGGIAGPPGGVTPRELEVLRLVASGRTNRQIAEALVISEKTVERHMGNLFTKLGVSNRAAATSYAYDHHLV